MIIHIKKGQSMNIEKSPSGKIVTLPTGYRAFIPNPLPPTILWDDQIIHALSRADFLIGKLASEGSKLPNPHLLIRPFMTSEAVLSSKIEGTISTVSDILAYNAGAPLKQNLEDVHEVQNYIRALDYGMKRLQELPLSLRLIKEIHQQLMQGVRGAHATPGEFRRSQNWIGLPGSTLYTAKFVPPPAEYLMDSLGDLEAFLRMRQLPALIHNAFCHYQFEAIHPFLDGNGRVGRLLIILLLVEQKILPSPLLYLSAYFEATRDEYYRQLYSVSSNGTWREWLLYFLGGVALQAEDALSRAERINGLLTTWRLQFTRTGSQIPLKIIERLAVNPYITTKGIAEEFDIAYTTAQKAIQRLESANIVTQINQNQRNRIYCATLLLHILEEPTKTQAS